MNVPSTPPRGSQPHGTNIGGEEQAGLATAGKSHQQSKLQQSFRSDLAGYKQVRYQSGVGIADEFAFELALHSHTL